MAKLTSAQVLQRTFGNADLVHRIEASRVLLVGAGGIGCEVLKGLLLTGFPRITIIDLDTIDVSNLNRQFLYNKSHVGMSKAEVAARVSVERFAHRHPTTGESVSEVHPIHDSILDLRYNQDFYRQFTFVINALDNNTTRVHVNRMCLAADIPLVESASAGYYGNVRLIKRNVTMCFECEPPRKDENTYASCTIRNTPSLPIHCVVWAKHLFAQLFGLPDEEDISPDPVAALANGESGSTPEEEETPKKPKQTTREFVESNDYDPELLFNKIFHLDVLYLHSMKNLWEKRRKPRSIRYEDVRSGEFAFDSESNHQNAAGTSNGVSSSNGSEEGSAMLKTQRLWRAAECLEVFIASLAALKEKVKKQGVLEWDKDDEPALDFVAAVSNFRCHCFFIARKSKFDVKALAGNIIPAISSTNTIVGGYVLLQTIKLLEAIRPQRIWKRNVDGGGGVEEAKEEEEEEEDASVKKEQLELEAERIMKNCFTGYITNHNGSYSIRKTSLEQLRRPLPDCIVCSGKVREIIVGLPLAKVTLAELIEHVMIKKFKCIAPDVNSYDFKKMIFAAEDEDELQDVCSSARTKKLAEWGEVMRDGARLEVIDMEQNFRVEVVLRDMTFDEESNEGEFFRILNQAELDELHGAEADTNGTTGGMVEDGGPRVAPEDNDDAAEDDQQCLEPILLANSSSTSSRKSVKRARSEDIVVDEDEDFIVLEHTKRIKTL